MPSDNTQRRFRAGALIIIIFLLAIFAGRWPYALFSAFVFTVAARELLTLAELSGARPPVWLLLTLVPLGHIAAACSRDALGAWLTFSTVAVLCVFVIKSWIGQKIKGTFGDIAASFLCLVYTGWFPAHGVLIRSLSDERSRAFWAALFRGEFLPFDFGDTGTFYLILIFLSVAFNDMAAFYLGRYFGREKLVEAISPSKTVQGALGGMIVGVLVGLFFAATAGQYLYKLDVPWFVLLPILLLLNALAVIGDLAESMIKRLAGAKDASDLIEGHGGVLDRFDSHLLALTCGYYCFYGLGYLIDR